MVLKFMKKSKIQKKIFFTHRDLNPRPPRTSYSSITTHTIKDKFLNYGLIRPQSPRWLPLGARAMNRWCRNAFTISAHLTNSSETEKLKIDPKGEISVPRGCHRRSWPPQAGLDVPQPVEGSSMVAGVVQKFFNDFENWSLSYPFPRG